MYHYGAGLPDAELTRLRRKTELFEQYGNGFHPTPEESQLLKDIRARVDLPYRKASGLGYDNLADRFGKLAARNVTQLPLTAQEVARWSSGVPPQKCTEGDIMVHDCSTDDTQDATSAVFSKAQIWEQFAYSSKLFRAGRVSSVALEFDFMDVVGDGSRPESVQRTYAKQAARPLARLIEDLKAAGLYDRTLIAIYTLDGSRRPAANSFANDGKGTILLAGGKVRGGYYGDITITKDLPSGGHEYAFRAPDPATGQLLTPVTDWGDKSKRTPSGSVWRTVIKAMGIPESEYVGRFDPAIDNAVPLDFMLKS